MAHPKNGYRNRAGKRVPGTTTVIGRFKESGGLLWWAFNQGKLAERGIIGNLYDKRDEAAEAGTVAHAMVEGHISGVPWKKILERDGVKLPVKEILTVARNGFKNYLNWASDNKIEVIHQEGVLVSEKFQYGGCPDAIGIDSRGKRRLLDWKTSNKVYSDYIIQVAAYKQLWDENHPDEKINGGCDILRFSKTEADFSHHHFSNVSVAFRQFKLFLKAYANDKLLKRRV